MPLGIVPPVGEAVPHLVEHLRQYGQERQPFAVDLDTEFQAEPVIALALDLRLPATGFSDPQGKIRCRLDAPPLLLESGGQVEQELHPAVQRVVRLLHEEGARRQGSARDGDLHGRHEPRAFEPGEGGLLHFPQPRPAFQSVVAPADHPIAGLVRSDFTTGIIEAQDQRGHLGVGRLVPAAAAMVPDIGRGHAVEQLQPRHRLRRLRGQIDGIQGLRGRRGQFAEPRHESRCRLGGERGSRLPGTQEPGGRLALQRTAFTGGGIEIVGHGQGQKPGRSRLDLDPGPLVAALVGWAPAGPRPARFAGMKRRSLDLPPAGATAGQDRHERLHRRLAGQAPPAVGDFGMQLQQLPHDAHVLVEDVPGLTAGRLARRIGGAPTETAVLAQIGGHYFQLDLGLAGPVPDIEQIENALALTGRVAA